MPIRHKDWNEIQGKAKALIAQKGEPFSVGRVLRRDVARKLLWISGFGSEPVPMMAFNGDINVYDEWVETDELTSVLTGSGNFIPHVSAAYIIVEAVGPGGGGAGSGGVGGGMGGGAGGYAKKRISQPQAGWPVAGYPYACGTGGNGGSTTNNGSNGSGPTTFGSPAVVTANAGTGGEASNNNIRGQGGTATGGDLNLTGGDGAVGGYGQLTGVGFSLGQGGIGGSNRLGTGGRGGNQGNGFSGHLYGGGGGGGGRTDGGNNSAGAAGANGGIIVTQRLSIHVVEKKTVTATPHVPQIGEFVLVAHHFGSRELPKCLGTLQSVGFAQYDPGLE